MTMSEHCRNQAHHLGYVKFELPGKIAYGCRLCGDFYAPNFDVYHRHIMGHRLNERATGCGRLSLRLRSLLHQHKVQSVLQHKCLKRGLIKTTWTSFEWLDAVADSYSDQLECGPFDQDNRFREFGY